MKKTIVSTCLIAFTLSPAWAEDIITHADVAVDIYATAKTAEPTPETIATPELENNETMVVQPGSEAVDPVIPPIIASSPIEVPKLSTQDNATLHLSLIRDEIDAMKEGGLFGGLFSSGSELQETLLQDITLFLRVYNDLPIASEAVYLQGQIQQKQGLHESAAISWLQTIYEYPDSEAAQHARDSLTALVNDDWDNFSTEIKVIMGNVPSKGAAARLSVLINQLYPLDDKTLVAALRLLQLDFLKRFPNDAHVDEVQVLMAHNMGAASAESGIFGFKKLLALYPNSVYRAEAMLAIADLQRLRLKEYKKAASNYQVLIQEYPDHTLAKNAYEHLALTQEKHLKTYPEAILTYQTIVTRYPESKLMLTSLQNMAALQERKTKEPRKAVDSLRKIATTFHGFEAVDALQGAIKIADKKIKDSALTFEIRTQLVKDFPNSDSAPKALFAMAEYADKTLQNTDQAQALYNQFIQNYSSHKLAKKVRERLK